MDSRFLMIGAAALTMAATASAEPSKPQGNVSSPAQSRPAEVVLASAEQLVAPAASSEAQPAVPAKRPRAARVTTCRCAGQVAQPQQSDQ